MKKNHGTNIQPITACQSVIADSLHKRYPTISHTARLLGIPVRTLQRRLQQNGINYSQLVEQTRLEQACHLLKDSNTPIAGIAIALGYADASSFTRAFRRWQEISPREYRRQQANHH